MSTVARWQSCALASATTMLLLWASYNAIRFGYADSLAIDARERMAQSEENGTTLTAEAASAIRALAMRSLRAWPDQSDPYETLGALAFAQGMSEAKSMTKAERAAAFQEATGHFRQAISRARSSPYAWASLLLAKHRAGEVDDEAREALRRAFQHGPYEPGVQTIIVEVGFSRWDQLTREEKGLIESTVQRGWETNRAAILREAAAVPGRERWCSGKAEAFPEICRALEQAAPNPVARATGGAVR